MGILGGLQGHPVSMLGIPPPLQPVLCAGGPLTGHTGAFYAERRPMIRPGTARKGLETTEAESSPCAGRLGVVV